MNNARVVVLCFCLKSVFEETLIGASEFVLMTATECQEEEEEEEETVALVDANIVFCACLRRRDGSDNSLLKADVFVRGCG